MTTCSICHEDLRIVTIFRDTPSERTVWLHVRPRTPGDDEDHEALPSDP